MVDSVDSLVIVRDDPVGKFYYKHCYYLPAMLGWFFFSAVLTSYNKYIFGDGHMKFPCPLLLTSVHFSIQWMFAHVACACFPESLGTKRVTDMTWREWAWISVPCGVVTSLDIGLSNLSLVKISVTFYTMVKSSTPIFVLGWAYIFKIERITLPLIGVILVIALGELLTVYGEVEFSRYGFILCLSASVLSGLRWTLVQTLLQALDPPLKSTIVTMKIMAPSMFLSMLVISGIIERPWVTMREAAETNGSDELMLVFVLGLIGGTIAVMMILCEFWLILRASAIILMIGGVIKELTTITVGVLVFHDVLNLLNSIGVCVVFSGVLLYKYVFHMQKQQALVDHIEAVPTEEQVYDEELFSEEIGFIDEDEIPPMPGTE